MKDGYRFVAVRVDDDWYTSSQIERSLYADDYDYGFEPVFQFEKWDRICEVADSIELATDWRLLD
ncbi:hypothetical protein K8O93_01800 [Gordonia bronchialis]|uniref:hypothetical protein n=1 Tax=Gordonia bronchialis TaxID=2054 RepID=UPI001CBB7784|nr:hypothetical protein [Gordonia bronchialis]UAK38553.1 hypothetical protein K8O93_01800 [Gordonia bronchialis]